MNTQNVRFFRTLLAAGLLGALAPNACAQLATLDKGHQLLVNSGLQIWGCDTGASSFTYTNLTNANMNGVMWSHQQSNPALLTPGQKWGKWVHHDTSTPATALNSTEQAHYADLLAIQVGDEQQTDIENPNGYTKAWFDAARADNYFTDKLLYVNSTFVNDIDAYFNFIATANPDAISWDAYPFGTTGVYPYNWLGKAQIFRRAALGSYIGAHNAAPRPYGLYLQTYQGGDGARYPGDLEMRWQQFTAWTLGYTFVDAFTVGGGTSLFNGGSMNDPVDDDPAPRYTWFKESARQSKNLGPALVKLISHGYGPNIVLGKNPNGVTNAPPIDWPVFNSSNAPPNQQYLASVGAKSLSHKNGVDLSNPDGVGGHYGYAGDVYVGFFNPLLTSYGDPAGTAYFMVTNALGAYLQDPSLRVTDCIQQITLNFNVGASGINSLQRLSRDTGLVEVLPLTHVSGDHYRYVFNLEGGTGDLFKYNDGSPFVGIEQPTSSLYWDNDGNAAGNNIVTGAGLGGAGTWDNSSSKWFNGATDGPWLANKTAVFLGTAGTVTLSAPQSAEGLQFKSNGYTITGSTLTVSGSTISVNSGMIGAINSTLIGGAGVNKTGPGTLVLDNASNTYTGGTTVSAGVLRASVDGNLGAAPGSFAAGNINLDGGTLRFGDNFDINGNRGITLGVAGGTIDTQSFSTINGYNSTDPNFDGGFRGDGDLTKVGSGTFFAAAATTGSNADWKGRLILKEGTWKIVASDGLPYNVPLADGLKADHVTLDGGTWQLGATFSVTNARRGVTVTANGGTVDTQHFNFTWAGPWAGNVPNANLNKIGSGTLRLNSSAGVGPGTYAGNFNVNGGTLQLNGGTAIGDLASINLANTTGVGLSITAAGETIGSLSGGGGSGGNVSLSADLVAGGNNKNTTFAGAMSGAGGFTKSGAGTMTMTGDNTHSGGTTIATGTLQVGDGGNTGSISGNITNNARLAFNRSDNVVHAGNISGSGSVEQRGAGTLTLSGSNTHSGGTSVSKGVLQVSADDNLGAVPASFAAGNIALDGGTLRFGADFDLSNNRGIALGAAGGTIDTQGFANPSGYTRANGISGSGNLTKIGNGTFFMNTPAGQLNTGWTGNLILKEGTWKVTERGGLPFNPSQTPGSPVVTDQITFDGGTLQIAAAIPNVTNGRRGITVAAGGGTFDTQSFTFNWAGPLAGNDTTAVLTKVGGGTLQFNTNSVPAPSTYAGDFNVAEGTLVLNGGAAMGDLAAISLADAVGVQLTISGASETIGSLAGGGAAGGNATLNASLTTGGNGQSTTFSGRITGSGALIKTGSGTLTLAPPVAGNTFTGGTTINGGTLRVNAIEGLSVGSGPVVVNSGATLAGTGSIFGAVTLNGDAHLAPGLSIGSLYVGPLTLAAGSILDFELDTIAGVDTGDLVNVRTVGGLNILGGTLNLSNAGNMTAGTYKLIEYDGRFNGSLDNLTFGNVPEGFDYVLVDNATTKSIDVVVSDTGDFNRDGFVNAADYVLWRKGLGFAPNDYDQWLRNFGRTLAGGSGSIDFSNVPEPVGGAVVSVVIFLLLARQGIGL